MWFGKKALESPLKSVHSPLVLHLATHGFFLGDQGGAGDVTARSSSASGEAPEAEENPLLRSGLALAGANTTLRGHARAPLADKGILTALDVAGMDLRGTELVVLSACDTGLGDVHRSEGVFGLRRSFHLAGASTLVMSLWQVPDKQTQTLMREFYDNLLNGMSRPDALRAAQINRIKLLRIDRRFPHPYYWGAFICQGDIAPIQWPKAVE
jgi:CHAT domain-containing protein